jgi:tetratricopeptide (TPR) repeat protein
MIMLLCHRLVSLHRVTRIAVTLLLSAASAVAAAAAAAPAPGAKKAVPAAAGSLADGNAATVSAESALQRGDCGNASAYYVKAARQLAAAQLAQRATTVALECGQAASALAAAERWVQLAPGDSAAALAQVQAALVNLHVSDARDYFKAWLSGANRALPDALAQLQQDAGSEALLLLMRGFEHPALHSAVAQRALGELALDSWDAHAALGYAEAARAAGAKAPEVALLMARAQAVLGDEAAALSAAREAATAKSNRLAVAQVLLLLGKEAEAETELQRLRSDDEVGPAASRQLAQLAFEKGDYAITEQRCTSMLPVQSSAALAVYLLGVIAERRGDDSSALRHYSMLLGTGLDTPGRRRAAGILYRQGDHEAALRVFAPEPDASPSERIHADIAAADLLSQVDAPEESLGRIGDALRRSPGNAELEYQHAVLLERAGKIDAALQLLETLHRARPLDAAVTNALGFTLADHKRALPRAEQLIREALRSQPDDPAMLDSLGWVLFRRGQIAGAVPILERAYRLLHDGDIGGHWGQALWTQGQKSAARAVWQRALTADPENPRLLATVAHYAPDISAPKPPPALESAPRTTI